MLLVTLAALGVWAFGIVDAWRQAKRRDPFVAAPWQTRTVYLSTFPLAVFVLLPTTIGYVRQHRVQAFRTPSNSMNPTLLPGDFLFADMRYNRPGSGHPVRRGDVAILGGTLRVNGEAVPGDVGGDPSLEMAERRVAPGHVFVLGDNRSASRDSRAFGDVPLSDVSGGWCSAARPASAAGRAFRARPRTGFRPTGPPTLPARAWRAARRFARASRDARRIARVTCVPGTARSDRRRATGSARCRCHAHSRHAPSRGARTFSKEPSA